MQVSLVIDLALDSWFDSWLTVDLSSVLPRLENESPENMRSISHRLDYTGKLSKICKVFDIGRRWKLFRHGHTSCRGLAPRISPHLCLILKRRGDLCLNVSTYRVDAATMYQLLPTWCSL